MVGITVRCAGRPVVIRELASSTEYDTTVPCGWAARVDGAAPPETLACPACGGQVEPVAPPGPLPTTRGVRVYLAARYARGPKLQSLAVALERRGHTVTSRWITGHGGTLPTSLPPGRLNDDPAGCARYARADIDDLRAADLVVSFTDVGGGKGGRHVEFGVALALGKRLVVVGPREHVFHALPEVEHYPDTAAFLAAMGGA